MKKTINIACGNRVYEHYPSDEYVCTNVDIRPDLKDLHCVCDVRQLPFEDETFDYALASDILEHFPIAETGLILEEWCRVLKKDGLLELRVPNLAVISRLYNGNNARLVSWLLYGAQDYEYNFHYVCFDRKLLQEYCTNAGLRPIEYREEGNNFILLVKK